MIRRAGFLMALIVASFLLFVGEAAAATATVGQDFEAGNVICGSVTDLQTSVSSGNSYTVAAAGVITSWSFHNGIDVLPDLKLKVAKPQSGGAISSSAKRQPGPGTSMPSTPTQRTSRCRPETSSASLLDRLSGTVAPSASVTPLTSSAATPRSTPPSHRTLRAALSASPSRPL
jgi:hypothetical protein